MKSSPSLQRWLFLSLPFVVAAEQVSSALRRQTQAGGLLTPLDLENHIIGGVDAEQGEFPFFVKFEGSVGCGGSLISPTRVLTAGHCIKDRGWPGSVRVGPTTLTNGEVIPVKCGVVHPGFFSPFITVLGDVAILKLETPVTSVANFTVLNRDADYPSVNLTDLTVIGYGKTSPDGGLSSTLRKVGTFFVPREDCVKTYNDVVVRPEAHICADVPNKGDCNGDSGGPLMDGNKVQVGVVSFGYGGCASRYQDVYAKVSTYIDWIDAQLTDESCPAPPDTTSNGGIFGCNVVQALGYYTGVEWRRITKFVGSVLGG